MNQEHSPLEEEQPSAFMAFLRRHIWFVGIALGLTLVTGIRPFLMRRPAPPQVLARVPQTNLVDQQHQAFTREDMLGKVWVVGFIFTRCPSFCPAISQAMVTVQDSILDSRINDDVKLLTITVDPEYDRPEVLAEYAERFGATHGNWRFVTGESDAIEHFVVDGFKMAIGDKMEKAPGVMDIAHSSRLAVVDRFGAIRGFYSTDAESLQELYHTLFSVMRATAESP